MNKIIKQIWNQRRMNGWIFIEIIIAGFFLWTVIDPMYGGKALSVMLVAMNRTFQESSVVSSICC